MADFDKSTFDPKAAAEARKKEMGRFVKKGEKGKDKNLRLLMQYAAEFHVDKILRQYFEVLL